MDELIELANIVTRNKVKALKTIDNADDVAIEFYRKIVSGEIQNDEDAVGYCGKNNANDPSYRRLKNKLKERLLNSLVFIDVNSPKFNDAQKAFYTCQKNLVLIRILQGRNAKLSSHELILKTLKYSEKYELTEISLELYKNLRNHHALRTGHRTSYLKCVHKIKFLQEVYENENLALDYLERLSLEIRNRSTPSQQYYSIAEEAIGIFDSSKVDTYRFILLSGSLKSNYLIQKRNYQELIVHCDLVIDKLNKKKYVSKTFHAQFHFLKLIAYAQLLDVNNGSKEFDICCKILDQGTTKWFNAHDIYFLLLVRVKKYQKAFELYEKVFENKSFNSESSKRKETWHMYEAYLFFLMKSEKISLKDPNLSKFRLSKFINEVPKFSTDKAGYNIPILVIQLLLLIQLRKYDKLTEHIEAIEKYTTRYLRKDNNFRSNCFIKMLLQIPKRQFHRKAVQRHASNYLAKLKSVPLSNANQSFEIEIIPYETLWEYVLESLDNRFH